jgi:hypothetical protein
VKVWLVSKKIQQKVSVEFPSTIKVTEILFATAAVFYLILPNCHLVKLQQFKTVLAAANVLFLACDANCTSGCSSKGSGKCDSQCAPGYQLTTDNFCVGS